MIIALLIVLAFALGMGWYGIKSAWKCKGQENCPDGGCNCANEEA